MPTFIYPGEGGSGSGSSDPTVLGVDVGQPSLRTYTANTAVQLPSVTINGTGTLNATLSLVMGSGGFAETEAGPFESTLSWSGERGDITLHLVTLYFMPGEGEEGTCTYTIQVTNDDGEQASSGDLQIENNSLVHEGKQASASFELTGTSGTLAVMVNGELACDAIDFDTDLATTAHALIAAINAHAGPPKFDAASEGGAKVNIMAPLGFGQEANGLAVTVMQTGTLNIKDSASGGTAPVKLKGGVDRKVPETGLGTGLGKAWDNLKTKALDILPTVVGMGLTSLALRTLAKHEVAVNVASETDNPEVAVLYDGMMVKVPAGYTPPLLNDDGTHSPAVYPDSWDYVTFGEPVLTDNPCWCLLEMIENKRFGCGNAIKFTDAQRIRLLQGLWESSKRADEMISNGAGGVEPRYSTNGMINGLSRLEALDALASCFNASINWTDDGLMVCEDAPRKPKRLVTNANVGNGSFKRTGGNLNSLYNRVNATYNEAAFYYEQRKVFSIDQDAVSRGEGERSLDVVLFGETSSSRAKRRAKMRMLNESGNPYVYTYVAGMDHFDLVQHDLVSVIDNRSLPFGALYAGGKMFQFISNTVVVLDRPVTFAAGMNLHITMPDGGYESHEVTNASTSNGKTTVTLGTPLSDTPVSGAIWLYHAQDLNPVTFEIIYKNERSPGIYEVSVVKYNEDKYGQADDPS